MSTEQAMNSEQLITENIDLWTSAIKAKKTQGRGSSSKRELYGIKKLRELILELAVRGKLVPQDPSDEPACVLLERIAAEKTQLVKDKKIKKPKKLPEITEQERNNSLPQGWSEARLGDVLNVLNGRAYKKHEMLQEGTPLLRVGNLFTSKEWYYSDLELEPEKYIDNGDLIYAWSASFGPFIWSGGKAIYHYHIWKLDLFDSEALSKNYLYQYLLAITEEIKASGNGIAMIHMTKERMEKLIFPIPPLPEQVRITSKIDELMTLCDQLEQQTETSLDAHQQLVDTLLATLTDARDADELSENWARLSEHFDTLITTDYAVEQLKQTILQLAVMGKLVPQDPNDEPASELLKRIAAEKAQLIKDKKIKKPKPLPEITDEEKPFELPDGWEWSRIGDGSLYSEYGVSAKTFDTIDGIPVLKMGDIQAGKVNLGGQKKAAADYEGISDLMLENGDVLYNRTNSAELVGKTGRFEGPNNVYSFASYLIRIKCLEGALCSQFMNLNMNTPLFRITQINPHLKQQCGQANVNGTIMKGMLVAVAPLQEQRKIIDKVDQLISFCDQLKSSLSEAQTTQLQLADTITEQGLR